MTIVYCVCVKVKVVERKKKLGKMVLLDQGGFLNALNRIYDSCKDKGSVRFTFKKCTF